MAGAFDDLIPAQTPAPAAPAQASPVVFGPGSPDEGRAVTSGQAAYAQSAPANTSKPAGDPTNPYYDRAGGQAPDGASHVDADGNLVQPGGSVRLGGTFDDLVPGGVGAKPLTPLQDIGEQIPIGMAQGIASVVGLPGDILDGVSWVAKKGGQAVSAVTGRPFVPSPHNPREIFPGFTLPDSQDVNDVLQDAAGVHYADPQTLPGAYARTLTSFTPAALAPGGALARTAAAVVPALASESAGQITKGRPDEGLARFLGGLAGGLGVGSVAAVVRSPEQVIASASRAATPQVLARADQLMEAGRLTGQPLTRAEAIDAASGGATTLNRTVRSVESVKRGKQALAPFYAARPGQVRQAVTGLADSIAPATNAPGVAAQSAQAAAQTALDQAAQLRNDAVSASLQGAGRADPAPAAAAIRGILESPIGQRDDIAGPLAKLHSKLFLDDAGMTPEAQRAYEAEITQSMGSDAPRPTQAAMQVNRERLGGIFDRAASSTTIPITSDLKGRLGSILDEAAQVLPSEEVGPIARQVGNVLGYAPEEAEAEAPKTISLNGHNVAFDSLHPDVQASILSKMPKPDTPPGEITGESYQALTRKGAPLDRALQSGDPNIRYYAGAVRDALDDALEGAARPEDVEELRSARRQYRNMKIVQDALNKTQPGQMVEPSALLASVRKATPNYAFEGGGDLGAAAEGGLRAQAAPATPQTDTAQLYGAKQALDGVLAAKSTLPATDPGLLALGRARSSLDGVIGAAAPDYAPTLAGHAAGVDARLVAPLRAGPVGQIAGGADPAAALYPSSPTEGQAAETAQAAHVLNSVDRSVLPQVTRAHVMDTFNAASKRLQNGLPNANSGPNFAKALAGNAEQESAINAGVLALPNGTAVASRLQELLDVHRAMGTKLAEGSPTAEKMADAASMKSTPLGGLLKTNIVEPGEGIAHWLESIAARRHVDGLSKWLLDQNGSLAATPTQPLPNFPWIAAVPASQQLRLQLNGAVAR